VILCMIALPPSLRKRGETMLLGKMVLSVFILEATISLHAFYPHLGLVCTFCSVYWARNKVPRTVMILLK